MHKLILLSALWLPGIAFPQAAEDELSKKIERLQSSVDPDDPDFEEKIQKAMKSLGSEIDTIRQSEEDRMVVGEEIAAQVREEISAILKKDETDPEHMREFVYSLPVTVISLNDPESRKYLETLAEFKSLKALILQGNKKTASVDLDAIIGQLEGIEIEELYVTDCLDGVTVIPESITNLRGLRVLGLYGNNIKEVPKSIGALENLEELYLDGNPISDLPYTLSKLARLKTLGLESTKIGPADMSRLRKKYQQVRILPQ